MIQEEQDGFPLLLFQLRGKNFCISSEFVDSISVPEQIIPLPDSPPHCMGITYSNSKLISLVDLRSLFGLGTLHEDFLNFASMRQKHLDWVEQLEYCTARGLKFTLPTDPHACAFGKWYDSYHTDQEHLRFILTRVSGPHARLHQCALEIDRLRAAGEESSVKEELEKAKRICKEEVIPLLDKLIEAYREVNKGMAIVIRGGNGLALYVDEVSGLLDVDRKDAARAQFPGNHAYLEGVWTLSDGKKVLEIGPSGLSRIFGTLGG